MESRKQERKNSEKKDLWAVYESKKRMAAQLAEDNPELYQREIRRIAREMGL